MSGSVTKVWSELELIWKRLGEMERAIADSVYQPTYKREVKELWLFVKTLQKQVDDLDKRLSRLEEVKHV